MGLPGRLPAMSSAYRNTGDGQYLHAPTSVQIPFTACGWVRREYADDADWHTVFSIDAGGGNGLLVDYYPWLQMEYNDGSTWRANGPTEGDDPRATSHRVYFWALVAKSSAVGDVTLYYSPSPFERFRTTSNSYVIGSLAGLGMTFGGDYWGQWLGGRLWNYRVWSRALSVSDLYLERRAVAPSDIDLWGWWPLEGNNNQLTQDWSGNRRHLTRTGGGPASFFVPSSALILPRPRSFKVPAAGTAPTLTAASVINLGATQATPRVTFTR